MLCHERVRDFIEAACLQALLEKRGYSLLYVDEFHFSLHSTKNYNWSRRSTPAMLSVDPETWTMSFVIAISRRKVEGVMASDHSIEKKSF